jgi:GUN4-like
MKHATAIQSIAIAGTIFLYACTVTQQQAPPTSPPPSPFTPAASPPSPITLASPSPASPPTDFFLEAENKAISAKNIAKIAQTKEDWTLVVNRWQQAIDLIKAVPTSNPKYALAQKQLAAYQTGLKDAEKQLKLPTTTAAKLADNQAPSNQTPAQVYTIDPTATPTPNDTPELSKLRNLLAAKKWKEADEETFATIARNPCPTQEKPECLAPTLRAIDQLWVQYSNGQFGFSVQKQLYDKSKLPAELFKQINWQLTDKQNPNTISGITYQTNAPTGHLPFKFLDYMWTNAGACGLDITYSLLDHTPEETFILPTSCSGKTFSFPKQ